MNGQFVLGNSISERRIPEFIIPKFEVYRRTVDRNILLVSMY
jgi:hypothetical protein